MAVRNPLSGVPQRAARWSALHPWRAILAWLAFVIASVGMAIAIPTQEPSDADYRLGESGRAEAWIDEAGLESPDSENVLITADGAIDEAQAEDAASAISARMGRVDGVVEVAEPLWSPDRSALLIAVQLAKDHDELAPLVDVTDSVRADYPDLEIRQTGDLSMDEAIDGQVADDLSSAEVISLPVTLILMLVAFGALIAAGIPVLLAGTSVAATLGLTAPVSYLFPAEPTVGSMIVLIGMAVGVDYSLFFLKREREERAAGRSTLDAVDIAAQTSGHSILVSGGAVIASMAGLYLIGDVTFSSLATGSILVVAIAVLGSITVLPAALARLGRWVDRPRVPLLWRLNRRIGQGGISSRILAPVVRRPGLALGFSGLVVVALAIPALGMKIHSSNIDTLPQGIPEVETYRAMADAFPSEGTSADLVIKSGSADKQEILAALDRVSAAALESGDFVETGTQQVETSADGRYAVLTLAMPYEESDDRVDDAIRDLREVIAPGVLDDLDVSYAVGGGAAESLDFVEQSRSKLPFVIGFVLLLTMIMMGAAFRSVPIALISTGLNLASVGVAFGVLSLVFQHGWFAGALDFTSPGFVIDWIPLFVMVVLVGLSMDYHVFVLSRVRELIERGLPARLAVRQGIAETAGVVTSAAAVMISVFAIFATLSMMEMKMMGVGLSAAILIDATVIRLVMLPAILVLLGDRAWWPRRPSGPQGQVVEEHEPAYQLA